MIKKIIGFTVGLILNSTWCEDLSSLPQLSSTRAGSVSFVPARVEPYQWIKKFLKQFNCKTGSKSKTIFFFRKVKIDQFYH